ncbi:helix-turn-helix transcriptional regulator [Pseudomonas veronii]|uniref:helix-turn-helix transcriptional regulator n=1 Tax=Pseudomonas veronii TaxID=76761 RepID=UPI002D7743C5|nr:helix-turn-helix transcriptional regulator [Pseudomonas veronii]WRU65985.1 helix-turn-helix transcriptional regulator [Pseudomonas veronii]
MWTRKKVNRPRGSKIASSYVGRIERGEVTITVEKQYRIASVLACDPCGLLPPVALYPVNTETFE